MYIKTIEQLTVGSTFFQERTYVGFVEFRVAINDGVIVKAESVSTTGYNFSFDQQVIDEYHSNGKFTYKTLEDAIADNNRIQEERIQGFLNKYKDDLEGFLGFVIKRAYQSSIDPEYGDDTEGEAIKQLAAIHLPGLDLDV